jgi:hypothetical protein
MCRSKLVCSRRSTVLSLPAQQDFLDPYATHSQLGVEVYLTMDGELQVTSLIYSCKMIYRIGIVSTVPFS